MRAVDRWVRAAFFEHFPGFRLFPFRRRGHAPTWLDEAVFAAYGWKPDLSDEEILEKLLALDLERSKV